MNEVGIAYVHALTYQPIEKYSISHDWASVEEYNLYKSRSPRLISAYLLFLIQFLDTNLQSSTSGSNFQKSYKLLLLIIL